MTKTWIKTTPSVLLALLFGGVLLLGACQKVDESGKSQRSSDNSNAAQKSGDVEKRSSSDAAERPAVPPAEGASAVPRDRNGQTKFDPQLLLNDAATAQYTVPLTAVTAPLEDKSRTAVVTLSFECTNAEAAEKIKKNPVKVQALVTEVLAKQSLASANSVEGKMKIREEIVLAANKFLGQPGVKQVHYLGFIIN